MLRRAARRRPRRGAVDDASTRCCRRCSKGERRSTALRDARWRRRRRAARRSSRCADHPARVSGELPAGAPRRSSIPRSCAAWGTTPGRSSRSRSPGYPVVDRRRRALRPDDRHGSSGVTSPPAGSPSASSGSSRSSASAARRARRVGAAAPSAGSRCSSTSDGDLAGARSAAPRDLRAAAISCRSSSRRKNSGKQLDDLATHGFSGVRASVGGAPGRRPRVKPLSQARRSAMTARATARTPAASCAPATSGSTVRLSGWVHRKRDHGSCSSSICATTTGSPSAWSTPASPHFAAAEALRLETVITVTGTVVPRAAGRGQPQAADRRDRAGGGRARPCSRWPTRCRSRSTATPSSPRRRGCATASSTSAASALHRNIVLRSRVIAQHPPAHDRGGLHRVPDADPHLELAGGRARLPGAEPRASRASSTRCRRRRSSSSSC